MLKDENIVKLFQRHSYDFHPVVPRVADQQVSWIDLSTKNPAFTAGIFNEERNFNWFIENERKRRHAVYLAGGYAEIRDMYRRSSLFGKNEEDFVAEPRCVHLGIDIWGAAGTPVFAPLGGMIHSFANNDHFGDYGATIILQHQLETINFYSLYGHLSSMDLSNKRVGQFITRGEPFAHMGTWQENGNWPPHLHFQIILDIGNYEGDYPGVCSIREREKYLSNSPDPNLVLNLHQS